VTLQRAKPLSTLYEEVADYDLVVVPDAPLASALNRHLDRPHLGEFATTPRRIAAGRRERAEERTVFLELLHETNLTWKQAAFLGEELIHCWEYTADPTAMLDYEQFATHEAEQAVDHVRDLDITSRYLTEFTVDASTDLAVIGEAQLTTLERSILPAEYDSIDRFDEGAFDRPPFRVFDTAADIVDVVLDAATEYDPEDIAVVLDAGSEFSTLVESGLDAADIPFYGGSGFLDDTDHRTFLRLLRAAFRGRDVCVKDVRPILDHLGQDVAVTHDEKRLHKLQTTEADWLVEWCSDVGAGERTFGEALGLYEAQLEASLETFRTELETLGLVDRPVTESRVDGLEFYLQSYEVPVGRENEGVLLADAKSATHVGRPLVFYLGLDDGWTRSLPQRPWVDRDREFERHLRQFQLLVQNGTAQHYLVRDTLGGSAVTPCLYFEELVDEPFEQFSDLDADRFTVERAATERAFDVEPTDVESTAVSTISQSSLGTYVNSPRDYFFSRLVDRPDKDYFREGSLFHDFAELYVHDPTAVTETDLDEFVDVMAEELAPFTRDVDTAVERTRYRAGLQNIIAFLDEHAPAAGELVISDTDRREPNRFAEHVDCTLGAECTERWFENDALGLKGKIDLVQSPSRLVDYKSGSKTSATTVVTNSTVDDLSDTPEYQAILYLAHQRAQHPGEQLDFVFVHFLENLADIVRETADLGDTLTTVSYYPTPFAEHVAQESVFEWLREDGSGDCRKTFGKTEYDTYRAAFDAAEFPDTRDSDTLIDSAWGEALTSEMRAAVGDYKYVTNGCEQAMRSLCRLRSRNYFEEDLDRFEAFAADRIDELNRRRAGEERFPIADLLDEPNYRRVDNRDLLLEGSR
jgi:hypothetical protein